jgi:hypothetical protein
MHPTSTICQETAHSTGVHAAQLVAESWANLEPKEQSPSSPNYKPSTKPASAAKTSARRTRPTLSRASSRKAEAARVSGEAKPSVPELSDACPVSLEGI